MTRADALAILSPLGWQPSWREIDFDRATGALGPLKYDRAKAAFNLIAPLRAAGECPAPARTPSPPSAATEHIPHG